MRSEPFERETRRLQRVAREHAWIQSGKLRTIAQKRERSRRLCGGTAAEPFVRENVVVDRAPDLDVLTRGRSELKLRR
jgi:hypothetical protein